MSHFTVVVCTPGPDHLDALLAPFDENLEVAPFCDYEDGGPSDHWAVSSLRKNAGLNPDDATLTWAQVAEAHNRRYGDETPLLLNDDGRACTMSTRNPQAKWDYWRVGGRWGGYFACRPGCTRLTIKPQARWDSPDIKPGRCDGGPKRALDLDGMRDERAAEARLRYAEYAGLVKDTPEALPWHTFSDNISPENGYTLEQAREEYHSQPRMQALKGTPFDEPFGDDPAEEFGGKSEQRYAEIARARAVPGFATVTTDGRWMAPGRMGWFAAHDDSEGDRIGYWEAANAYIGGLSDDTWLIAVDCHI